MGELDEMTKSAIEGSLKSFAECVARLASWRNRAMGITEENFPKSLKNKIFQETKLYFETGNCNSSERNSSATINPTLLEPKTLRWRVDCTSCPFDSYVPLLLSDIDGSVNGGIATRHCQKILKTLIGDFQKVKKDVHFHFILADCLNICLEDTTEKFDVIDCSTLADNVGLVNVIVSGIQKLELHPRALLLTDTNMWGGIAPTLKSYVEEWLCAPLSVIPTIYGLRIANPVELGSTKLMGTFCTGHNCPPATLTWLRCPRFENVPLGYSPLLERCLKTLEKKCYFIEDGVEYPAQTRNLNLEWFTPLTFNFIATRIAECAVKEGTDCRMKLSHSRLHPRFALAQRALEDWANNRPVTLVIYYDVYIPYMEHTSAYRPSFLSSMLRIILVPIDENQMRMSMLLNEGPENHPFSWASNIPNVHYIDNFQLLYRKKQDGSNHSLQITFLLPQDHGLGENYSAAVIDISSGMPVIFTDSFYVTMRQQPFNCPHPISKQFSPRSEAAPGNSDFQAVDCQESETDYVVQFKVNKPGDPKGNRSNIFLLF